MYVHIPHLHIPASFEHNCSLELLERTHLHVNVYISFILKFKSDQRINSYVDVRILTIILYMYVHAYVYTYTCIYICM